MSINIPHTITLKYPVQIGEKTVTELVFGRRMTAGDFKGISASEITFDHMILIIARLTVTPAAIIEKLDAVDMMECAGVIRSFLPTGLTTGGV